MQRLVSLAVEPRLSNGKFTGSSATTWYLLAAPVDVPMVVGFLDGKQAPTTEFFGLDHDVNTLGVAFRGYFDFGAALGDYRAALKAAGAYSRFARVGGLSEIVAPLAAHPSRDELSAPPHPAAAVLALFTLAAAGGAIGIQDTPA